MEDLDETINYYREALVLCPLGHQHHSMSVSNLASSLQTRYEASGQMEDLKAAITYNREALTLRPPGHPDRVMSLNNLANTIRSSHHKFSMEDVIMYN